MKVAALLFLGGMTALKIRGQRALSEYFRAFSLSTAIWLMTGRLSKCAADRSTDSEEADCGEVD
jgi:hypothetical protein